MIEFFFKNCIYCTGLFLVQDPPSKLPNNFILNNFCSGECGLMYAYNKHRFKNPNQVQK